MRNKCLQTETRLNANDVFKWNFVKKISKMKEIEIIQIYSSMNDNNSQKNLMELKVRKENRSD